MKKLCIWSIAMLMLLVLLVGGSRGLLVSAKVENASTVSSAKSYIVVDENNMVLVENNCDEKREVASICKLMTSLITLENIEAGNISLDDKFLASDYACMAEGSQAFLDAGCEYRVRDLLKSVIVASANDSAIVLAENIAGSEDNFVKLMNEKAVEIGMENTLYANSTGLDDKMSQYSTARDTAKILNKISEFDVYKEYSKIWMDTLTHPSGRTTELVNTNRLVKYYPYCLTGKTGFTDEAGYCLSSISVKDDFKLTCVVLGCKSSADRFSDSISLYNYSYANFENINIVSKGDIVDNDIDVVGGKTNAVQLIYASDFAYTTKKNADARYSVDIVLPEKIIAPIASGETLGYARVLAGDDEIGRVNIVVLDGIEHQTYKDIVGKIFESFSVTP